MARVDIFKPKEVYVYAIGHESWLEFISRIKYTAESLPFGQSNLLTDECTKRGLIVKRLLARKNCFTHLKKNQYRFNYYFISKDQRK